MKGAAPVDWEIVFGYLFIFGSRVFDVSLGTVRTLMLVRGRRVVAALLGFVEVLIYIIALRLVVNSLSNPIALVVYAMGFSTGNFMGGFVEEKLAFGQLTVQVIPHAADGERLAESLRDKGYGVTVLTGEGREGQRHILLISIPRRALAAVMAVIDAQDAEAFVTVLDTKRTRGGVFPMRKGK
ncbi:MAG TPA: DUF2179 domain-containing protein [Firmicutes bacterium]|jgi:uncharacterized protein YebE (UPF0316 family)|nr:DUF2179 domain-containing protein [Bacillota bacterium]